MTSKEITIGSIKLTRDEVREVYAILKKLECKNGEATINEETLKTIKQKLFISYHHLNTIIEGLTENAEEMLDDKNDLTIDQAISQA